MTSEKLYQARKLSELIDELKKHKEYVEEAIKRTSPNLPISINTVYRDYHDKIGLKREFLNVDEFTMIYIVRVDAKIKELETEFDNL